MLERQILGQGVLDAHRSGETCGLSQLLDTTPVKGTLAANIDLSTGLST